jgi:YD repeat-containing protein
MTKIWYDLNDNVTKVEDELGRQSNMVYDNMDQVISASHCVGRVSSCDLCARSWLCCLFCRISREIEVERSWEHGRNVAH